MSGKRFKNMEEVDEYLEEEIETEKRFTYKFYDGLNVDILDNNEPVATMSAGDGETVTELLNRMNDENEELRQQRDYYEKICTEEGLI